MNSRLTGKIRNPDGSASSIKPIADDKGFPNKFGLDVLTKLADYEDLEEQGGLIKLPCGVGDTIYYPEISCDFIFPVKILQIIISDFLDDEYCVQYNGAFFNSNEDVEREFEFDDEDFGKIVFRTEKEAEAKLKELTERIVGDMNDN